MMKRFFIILLILIAILTAGGYFLFMKTITPTELPVKVVNAEEAIATAGTIAIASADLGYVRHINKMFKLDNEISLLSSLKPSNSKPVKTFLDKLNKQGVNLIPQTDYILVTINVSQEKPTYSFVLFGRFSETKLKQSVEKSYLVDESAGSYLLISDNDAVEIKDPCAAPYEKIKPEQQALHIKNDRIVLTSSEFMPLLLDRFAKNAPAEVSLTNWRQFRKEKAVVAALLSPKELEKGAADLPSTLLLGALSKQPLNDIYASAVVSMLPSPGFTFSIEANSNQATWPLDFKAQYDNWLNEVAVDLKEIPALATLLPTLKIQAEGSTLRIKTIVEKNTLINIKKYPSDFLKIAFTGIFGDGMKTVPLGEEEIVNKIEFEEYKEQFDFSSIQAFDEKNVIHKPDYITGPFSVRLKKFGLFAIDDSIIELQINAEGKGFENLPTGLVHKSELSPVASLSITNVEDEDGNNILRNEQCGNNRNLLASSLTIVRDKEKKDDQWFSKSIKVHGNKNIRLKKNIPLSKVAKIQGIISVRAATQTQVHSFKKPFSGKKVDTGKVRLYLRKSSAGTVKYTLSGDMTNILAIRAKNAKGDYLADAGSDALGKETKMVSKNFKGEVASVEVVIAEQVKTQDYPFYLKQVSPQYAKVGDIEPIEMDATTKRRFLKDHAKMKYKNECKDKQNVRVGAFMVCLNKFGGDQDKKIGGAFDVIAPYDVALQNDISAAVVSIDSVIIDGGKEISFNKKENVSFVYKFNAEFNKKKKNWEIINRRLYGASVNIFSDNKELQNKKIKEVKGTLTVRFPKRSTHIELGATDLGIAKKSKDGIITKITAFEDWNTYIDVQGPVEKIMRFMPVSKLEKILRTENERIYEKKYNVLSLSNEDKEKIKGLPKKYQGVITIYGQPKVIRVFYANKFDVIKHQFQFAIK